jgi:hypothetical protein
MSTRTLPRDTWQSFFDSFSRQHHGWLVWLDNGIEGPLESIRVTSEGIEIEAGGEHYRVARPTIVTVTTASYDDAAVDHLEIESGSDKVVLRFRATINPELVDGM